ncbi:MAG: ATP-binding protein [Anaerolineae bacterium]
MLNRTLHTLGLADSLVADEHVNYLHARSVLALALCCTALSYLWLFQATTFLAGAVLPSAHQVAPPLVLTLSVAGAVALRRKPSLAAFFLVLGLSLGLYFWQDPIRYYLPPMVVCIAGLLLSRYSGLATALALSYLPGAPREAVIATWLTAVAIAVASDYVHALIAQAIDREDAAVRLERQLLERRAELRRLNDSLRNAYALLERTNHELAEVRDEAEDARRLKAQFAAAISHELRTPLNLVLGFSELMYKMPEQYAGAVITADLRGDIREIHESTRHLLDLVDDVLDLSRVDQVQLALVPESADIGAIVREAAAAVAGLFRGRPSQLRLDLAPGAPACTVDRTRIRQVVINLLTNAARYGEDGDVTVSVVHDEPHQEVITAVTDTGPGIGDDERQRVFEAFYQVSTPLRRVQGGSGLGLAICKTFVQLHGGRIWVERVEGGGSRFAFSIPVHGGLHPATGEWRLQGAPDPFGESLVVLDPDGRAAALLERALPALRVVCADTPERLPDLVSRWHPKAVVAVTTDGEGSDARQLSGRIGWPGLPLISCYLPRQRPLSEYANVRGVIAKPVTTGALLEAVDGLSPVESLLIADDDEGMTRLVHRTLTANRPSIRLMVANDGGRALALMSECPPDVVVMDLAMPVLDGLAVLDAMAAQGLGEIPVLVLTGMEVQGSASIAAERLVISSGTLIPEAEVARYVRALADVARPRYADAPALSTPMTISDESDDGDWPNEP